MRTVHIVFSVQSNTLRSHVKYEILCVLLKMSHIALSDVGKQIKCSAFVTLLFIELLTLRDRKSVRDTFVWIHILHILLGTT